jgi:hypothetical protein
MKKKHKSQIRFRKLQFKSLESIQKFCQGLSIIEETNGIHECEIYIEDCFVCPWISLSKLKRTPLEKVIQKILREIKFQQSPTGDSNDL